MHMLRLSNMRCTNKTPNGRKTGKTTASKAKACYHDAFGGFSQKEGVEEVEIDRELATGGGTPPGERLNRPPREGCCPGGSGGGGVGEA